MAENEMDLESNVLNDSDLGQEADAQNKNECNAQEALDNSDLLAELNGAKEKLSVLNDSYLRLMADFDNFRKKTLKDKSDLLKYGSEAAIKNLLPVIDNFERAKLNIQSSTDVQSLSEGVELIYQQFMQYLKENNVSVIDSIEAKFDTDFHEAITVIPAPADDKKGIVIDCIQKGYMLNDKVIRFAKVVVGE